METKDQETFLKNMPRAIDSRIVTEKPLLARAIAAEHLIQVIWKFDNTETIKVKDCRKGLRNYSSADFTFKNQLNENWFRDPVRIPDKNDLPGVLHAQRQD